MTDNNNVKLSLHRGAVHSLFPKETNAEFRESAATVLSHPLSNGDVFLAQDEAERLMGSSAFINLPEQRLGVEHMASMLDAAEARAAAIEDWDPDLALKLTTTIDPNKSRYYAKTAKKIASLVASIPATSPFKKAYKDLLHTTEPDALHRDTLVAIRQAHEAFLAGEPGSSEVMADIFLTRTELEQARNILHEEYPLVRTAFWERQDIEVESGTDGLKVQLQQLNNIHARHEEYDPELPTDKIVGEARDLQMRYQRSFPWEAVSVTIAKDLVAEPNANTVEVAIGHFNGSGNRTLLSGLSKPFVQPETGLVDNVNLGKSNSAGDFVVFISEDSDGVGDNAPTKLASVVVRVPVENRSIAIEKRLTIVEA